jgi:hypothetical protein
VKQTALHKASSTHQQHTNNALTAPMSQHVPPQQLLEVGHIWPDGHSCWPEGTHTSLTHWPPFEQQRPPHTVEPAEQHMALPAQIDPGGQIDPAQSAEPAATHWLFKHTEVDRSQQRPPQTPEPRAQQTESCRQSKPGRQTSPRGPQTRDPAGKHLFPRHASSFWQHTLLPQHFSPAAALQQPVRPQRLASRQQRAPAPPAPGTQTS